MRKKLPFYLLFLIALTHGSIYAQSVDSILKEDIKERKTTGTIASFKSNRLILSQTTTMVKKNDLDFKVIHRFGDVGGIDGGSRTLYGFDNSSDININFEYGISDRLNVAFSRSKFEQLLDLQLKYQIFSQNSSGSSPFSAAVIAKTGFTPYKTQTNVFDDYGNRFSYFFQGILARKFSSKLSLQLSPSLLFRNVVLGAGDERSLFAIGAAGRYKFTPRFGLVADYVFVNSDFRKNNTSTNFYNPLGLGVEIETGGHVFTLNFANSKAISENNFIPNTTSSWTKNQYRFGFTISRMFSLKHANP